MEDRDVQMASMMNKIESLGESNQADDNPQKLQDVIESSAKQQETQNNLQVSADGSIPVDQLKEIILGTIKDKYEGTLKYSLTYAKPYTQRIDQLKMPISYQPPKFQQFDGKGNPKQHSAHIVKTYNNARTDEDLLVKLFVHTLKGNAFD